MTISLLSPSLHLHTCIFICIYIYTCMCPYISYIYIYIYIYIHVSIIYSYIHIHTYIYIQICNEREASYIGFRQVFEICIYIWLFGDSYFWHMICSCMMHMVTLYHVPKCMSCYKAIVVIDKNRYR